MNTSTTDNRHSSRIVFLDIAKGFAILFMFTQHCMLVHEKTAGQSEDLLASIFILLGTAPAAPVFMLIMGVFLNASRASLKTNLIRGVKLIILGYLLNFIRFTVPLLIAGTTGFQYSENETPFSMLLSVDILQLAGLSIIVGSTFKKFILNRWITPLIILLVLFLSPYLWSNYGHFSILSFLWGSEKNVYFPFFPWFIYPLLGMYLSSFLLNTELIDKNLKKLSLFGIIFLIIAIAGMNFPNNNFMPIGDYHRSGATIHSLIIGFIFLWLSVCRWISKRYKDNPFIKVLIFWSKNVTAVYFIQWVLFGWSILIFNANSQNSFTAALIGLGVLMITHFSIKLPVVKKIFSLI